VANFAQNDDVLFGHQRTALAARQARGLEITTDSFSERLRCRRGRGSKSGVARISASAIAASPSLATLVGEQTRITWPAEWDLRIAMHDPVPVYPHALIWRADNPHPALAALRDYLGRQRSASPDTWAPSW
jgi:hypothetical protein